MQLSDLITSVTTLVQGAVPDMGVYIAAGVVIGLGVYLFRRFVKGGK